MRLCVVLAYNEGMAHPEIVVLTGLPLAWGYVISSVIVIPLVFHGITFISRFQLWTQPFWLLLQILPLAVIFIADFSMIENWAQYESPHQSGDGGFNILLFGAAASVMFALVAQIGEQVDFLRRFYSGKLPVSERSTRIVPPVSDTGTGSSRRPCSTRSSSSLRSAARAK